jgi:S-DNA-T family DNA segregation ATPase FtsK/SpoIIIE
VFAAFAPVLASLAMWAVTQSVLALAFAALGPVIAVATTADSRIQRRRSRKTDAAAFAADIARTRVAIEDAHSAERRELDIQSPLASALVEDLQHQPVRWRRTLDEAVGLRLGSGSIPSSLDYDDPGAATRGEPDVRLEDLRDRAARVPDAPVTVDARTGVGFAGPAHFTLAAARGLELQLAVFVSPASASTIVTESGTSRVSLRSGVPRPGSAMPISPGDTGPVATVAVAVLASDLPRELGVVVEIDAAGFAEIVRFPDVAVTGPVRLEYVSLEMFLLAKDVLAACAEREGVTSGDGEGFCDEVEFLGLPQDATATTLRAAIGADGNGAVRIDLVADGPHAIVGGTTGSGKSELLTSWVVGMARERGPDVVTFLFVDFKGGAAFDGLQDLRQCVGVITDLDPQESLRALTSIGAELRHRERELARLGLRSIADFDGLGAPPFPRLVIVVDEYAALVETHSVLHSLFADIAARGRSLGVHLVLCTQRPAGVVRDSILANCALRISLRVTSAADSTAVIGTDAAAGLPARPLGRALLSVASAPPELLQVARTTGDDIRAVVDRWSGAPAPRTPWLPPLPHRIPLVQGSPGANVPFGIVDRPDEQRREDAFYDPLAHGSLMIVGNAGSGKSGVLDAMLAASSGRERVRIGPGLAALWDALATALATVSATPLSATSLAAPPGPGRLLLIDDIDAIVASCSDDYQVAILDLLARVLREAPAQGIHLVLTAQRIPGALNSIAALCDSRLVLRTSDRQEHLLAGGASHGFVADLPPGAGHWRGHRAQVYETGGSRPGHVAARAVEVSVEPGLRLAVVSTHPERFGAELRLRWPAARVTVLGERRFGADAAADPARHSHSDPTSGALEIARGDAPELLVSDSDGWQANWSLLAQLRRESGIVFDGCTPSEIRALTRVRELPPPFDRGERPVWLLDASGDLHRARLPVAPPAGAA